MTTRFQSPYGGTETIVGTFSTEEVERAFGEHLRGWRCPATYVDGKVFDIFPSDNREILGYMTHDHRIRVHCINR